MLYDLMETLLQRYPTLEALFLSKNTSKIWHSMEAPYGVTISAYIFVLQSHNVSMLRASSLTVFSKCISSYIDKKE